MKTPMLQATLGIFVFNISLIAHVRVRPYRIQSAIAKLVTVKVSFVVVFEWYFFVMKTLKGHVVDDSGRRKSVSVVQEKTAQVSQQMIMICALCIFIFDFYTFIYNI